MSDTSTSHTEEPASDGGLLPPLEGNDVHTTLCVGSSPGAENDVDASVTPYQATEFDLVAWGKSVMRPDLDLGADHPLNRRWLPLVTHLHDTLWIADTVWEEMLSAQVKRVLTGSGDMSLERAKRIYIAMCGIHDIGKASREFVYKNAHLQERFQTAFPDLNVSKPLDAVRHETVSHYEFIDWVYAKMGLDSPDNTPPSEARKHRKSYSRVSSWGVAVGGHHGVLPNSENRSLLSDPGKYPEEHARSMGQRDMWRGHRHTMMDRVAQEAGLTPEDIEHIFSVPLGGAGQVIMCAAVIVADWLASNEDLCALGSEENPAMPDYARARAAMRTLDLPDTWEPSDDFYVDFSETFKNRFLRKGSTGSITPRPVQAALKSHIDAHAPVDGGMFLIIEDATGSGKTEAGLSAAEMLAYKSGARGVMVALPTMATSNAMFDRVHEWITRLDTSGKEFSTQLVHSQAALNEDKRALKRVGMQHPSNLDSICCDDAEGKEATAVIHSWMSGSKKAILSDFVVGTIDQVLYAGLNRKYITLPHLGLAQKVLIIDEVHDHDVYMRQFLVRVLRWLGAYGVPVVALSATLTPQVRAELHAAYSGVSPMDPAVAPTDTRAYPLITSSYPESEVQVTDTITAIERTKVVEVKMVEGDTDSSVVDIVRAEAGTDGCVAVICNTVSRAQKVFSAVRREMATHGWEVELIHSRYTIEDRRARETALVERLGNQPSAQRPFKYILVGTQVLEQSLDVDFDLMVSDICPASALIQRMGRLHRHTRANRSTAHLDPKLIVTGFSTYTDRPDVMRVAPGTRIVYGTCAPMLTGAMLSDRLYVTSPTDVPSLVVDPFSDEAVTLLPDAWRNTYAVARQKEYQTLVARKQKADKWLIPYPPQGNAMLMAGWGLPVKDADSAEYAAVRDSVMDKTALIMYEDQGELFILSEGTYTKVTGKRTGMNTPTHVIRVARQEVKLPKSARGVRTEKLSDLDKRYTFRWDIARFRWIVDVDANVLVLEKPNHTSSCTTKSSGDLVVSYDRFHGLECVEL